MKSISLFILACIGIFLFIPFGCQKEAYEPENMDNSSAPLLPREGNENLFVTGGVASEDTSADMTTLGPQRENPYTIDNFTAAYNELYNPDTLSLPITHYYIKFSPTTHEQVALLASSELNIVEFPLDREIIHLGDFYLEPGATRDQIIPLYAVVQTSQVLPNVPYINLANLHLGSADESLVRRALERKGYNPDEIGYTIEPPYDGEGGGGGGGGGIYTTNSCGCQVYSDIRRPGGCVQVKDEQKNTFQGVRRVKVVIKDNFFEFHTVYTDDNGCFKVNNRFFGRAYMWIHFNSESRGKVRGIKKGWSSIFQWAFPVKHHLGTIFGPFFNDIQIKYDSWHNEGSDAHLYWGAATVGNAMHDFHDIASTDGINTPPLHLDIFVGVHYNYGYALMSGQDDLVAAIGIIVGVVGGIFLGPFGPILDLIGSIALAIYLPDVYVGINNHNSDRVKKLAFHEIAHASHFTKVNEPFWDNLVWAEIIAGGHGSQTSSNADLISIVESWAEYIGLSFAHKSYLTSNTSSFGSWQNELELTRNESLHHIPIGLFNDLNDNVPDLNPNICDQDFLNCGPINDLANGFTDSQMFNLLDLSTDSPLIFKNRLIENVSLPVQDQVNNLFNSY